jgi:hypothetical protein
MKIDNVEKGEIVYCNVEIQYERTNSKMKKLFNKVLNQAIFARPHDCTTFPELDVVKYYMLINKIDRKNSHYISKAKVVNLEILANTGYINENIETRKTRRIKN